MKENVQIAGGWLDLDSNPSLSLTSESALLTMTRTNMS